MNDTKQKHKCSRCNGQLEKIEEEPQDYTITQLFYCEKCEVAFRFVTVD